MIKAILFDFDGVLTKDKDDKVQLLRIFKRKTKLSDTQIMDVIMKHIGADVYYGRTGFSACWKDLCDELSLPRGLEKEYIEKTPMDRRILRLASRLKEHYRIGIITTNSSERMKKISKQFGLSRIFPDIFVSADMGVTKREKKMFTEVLKKMKVKPEEVLFIDNSPGNLVEPKKLGIHTYLYEYSGSSYRELAEEMKNLGILI